MTPLSVPEREAWAKRFLDSAEKWPEDGPHLQPKQFVRVLVRQYLAELAALTDLEERAERERELRTRAKSQLREHREGPGIRQAAESLLIRAEQAEERERKLREALERIRELGQQRSPIIGSSRYREEPDATQESAIARAALATSPSEGE